MPTSDDGIPWRELFGGLNRPGVALPAQIRQFLTGAIEAGHLSPGRRLPSTRYLAATLGIARNSVSAAYDQLIAEGTLLSQARSGVFVAAGPPACRPARPVAGEAAPWQPGFAIQPSALRHISKPRDWQAYPYPFLFGQFDPALFPIQPWRESVAAASSVASVNDWAADLIDEDDADLVAQLRASVLPRRAVWAAADEVMITLGAQQALSLAIQLLVAPGTAVAMEDPGYPDARHMVQLAGGRLHGLAVDDEGAVPDAALAGCRVAVLTPGHQCPTTAIMSPGRRQGMLAGVRAHGITVIEDDYDADLFQEGPVIPPLKASDAEGRVVYLGSLSKVVAPGLRLGYVVAAAPIIRELRSLRRILLRHPPSNNQRAMAMFISLGHYRAHLRRLSAVLAERAAIMDRLLPELLPRCTWHRAPGAASTWLEFPAGTDARAVAVSAAATGVLVEPGDVFFADPERGRATLRLGFSSIRTGRIEEGLRRLASQQA